jgi:uncharacterized protein with GYD domain
MPKYLFDVSYTAEGAKGVLANGGSARKAAVEAAAASLGGRLESLYFAFGSTDVYAVLDAPDNESAAAMALAVASSGAGSVRTVVLLTPEQVDAVAQKKVTYTPPGG